MANKTLRAVVAAVSLSLALTPISFAQGSGAAAVTVAQANNTAPLPGAKVAGAGLAPLAILGIIGGIIAVGLIANNANKSDDDALLAAFLARQATATTATGTR